MDQPRLDSKVTPKSTTWLTRSILFSRDKLYFEEAFFERQKIISLVLLVLITSLLFSDHSWTWANSVSMKMSLCWGTESVVSSAYLSIFVMKRNSF